MIPHNIHHICDVTIYIQKATYIIVVIDIAFEYLLLVGGGKPHGFVFFIVMSDIGKNGYHSDLFVFSLLVIFLMKFCSTFRNN